MKSYLLLCFVDLEKEVAEVEYQEKKVEEIMSIINSATKLKPGFTFLFENESIRSHVKHFYDDVSDFLNDPIEIYLEEQEPDVLDYQYEEVVFRNDYTLVYLQFVSSEKIFNRFVKISENFDFFNAEESHVFPYKFSAVEQNVILSRLQKKPDDNELIPRILWAPKQKRLQNIRIYNNRHKN